MADVRHAAAEALDDLGNDQALAALQLEQSDRRQHLLDALAHLVKTHTAIRAEVVVIETELMLAGIAAVIRGVAQVEPSDLLDPSGDRVEL